MWQTLSDLATGKFGTEIIAPFLVALATSITAEGLKQWMQERKRRKNASIDEVKRLVALITDLSERAHIEVELQLTGTPTKSFKNSQQQVGSQL